MKRYAIHRVLIAFLATGIAFRGEWCSGADKPAAAGEQIGKINVADLLEPGAARFRAFHQFRLRANPGLAKEQGWESPAEFAKSHHGLSVTKLEGPREGAGHILVVWQHGPPVARESAWATVAGAPQVEPPARSVTLLGFGKFQIFREDGTPIETESETLLNGNVLDLNADGEPDIVQQSSSVTGSGIPGLPAVGGAATADRLVSYLVVQPAIGSAYRPFAIVYNTHSVAEAAAENLWDAQVRDADADGLYEIELGPALSPEGLDPKVTIRWSKTKQTWDFPAPQPGDHFSVLTAFDRDNPTGALEKDGGLPYPLIPAATEPKDFAVLWEPTTDPEALSPELLSKTYEPRPLARLADSDLLRYFECGRSGWDYVADRMGALTSVPDFWTLPPRSAALEYVLRNRPPSLRRESLATIFNPGNAAAPDAGDLTLSDGPSGCFAPSGAFVHHLHCAPEGSFLIRAEHIAYLRQKPPTQGQSRFEFRRIDLSYEVAKHLLQTVWWLSRVRTRPVDRWGGGGMGSAGSTSDGHAVVYLVSGQERLTVSARRAAGHTGTFLGLGEYGSDYDPCALINLVVQLFAREAPERLGGAWKSQAIPDSWENRPVTAEQVAATKLKAAEVLRLYAQGLVEAGVASVAVMAVGENGWRELREDMERLAGLLPPLRPHEARLGEIDTKIVGWVQQLGPEAAREGCRERDRRRVASEHLARARGVVEDPAGTVPGLSPPPPPPEVPENPAMAVPGLDPERVPLPPSPEDLKFAEVDALHRARGETEYNAPPPDRAIAELRQNISTARQQLDWFDDPEALFAWAQRDDLISDFVLARLVKLDRALTLKLLRWLEEKAEHPGSKERYAATRGVLESDPPADDAPAKLIPRQLTPAEIATELAILRDAGAEYHARARALDALIPAEDPHRNRDPAIGDALLELLGRDPQFGGARPANLPIAAARRLGNKAWDVLLAYPDKASAIGLVRLSAVTPALSLIATREPDPWRARLVERLRQEFAGSYGHLNDTFWCLWLLEARDAAPELQILATRSPDDYESTRGSGGSNHRAAPIHRFHRARHLLALWSEQDAFTRARALLAFAVASADTFESYPEVSAQRLRNGIANAGRELSSEQIERLRAFAQWCEHQGATVLRRPSSPEAIKAVTAVFRSALPAE